MNSDLGPEISLLQQLFEHPSEGAGARKAPSKKILKPTKKICVLCPTGGHGAKRRGMSSASSTLLHANLIAASTATALTIARVGSQANAKAPKASKASKAPKAPKGSKARKAPKAAQATEADQEAGDAEGAPATATPQSGEPKLRW